MRNLIMFFALILIFTSCSETGSSPSVKTKVWKVGVLFPSDTRYNHKNLDVFKTLEKTQGKLNNHDILKIEVSYVKESPKKSFLELNKHEDLVAIISFLNTTQTLVLKEEIQKSKIPVISTLATHSEVIKIDYVSRICLSNKTQAHVAAAYLRDELFIPQVYVLRDKTNEFSMELSTFFIKRYIQIGGVVEENFDINNLLENSQSFINKLRQSKIDALYLSLDALKTKELLTLLKKEKIYLNVLADDGLLSAFMSQYPDDLDLLNGVFVVDNYADNLVLSQRAKGFKSALNDIGYTLDSYALLSFDAWNLLTQSLNTCENKKDECVNQHIQETKGFEGAVESIPMQDSSAHRAVYVNEIKHSKMKLRVKVY